MNKSKEYFSRAKKRLPYALSAGFACSFMYLFFGILDIFAGNRDEFMFAFRDFGLDIALIASAVALAIAALITFLPGKASSVVFGLAVWAPVMGYIQALLLNGGGSLEGDASHAENVPLIVIDVIIWVVTAALFVTGALFMEKKDILKKILIILSIMIIVMQITGCVTQIGDITREQTVEDTTGTDTTGAEGTTGSDTSEPTVTETDTAATDTTSAEATTAPETAVPEDTTENDTTAAPDTTSAPDTTTVPDTTIPETTTAPETTTPVIDTNPKNAYLTEKGLSCVSNGKNVVIFLIDRFDVSFYKKVVKSTPDFFNFLDGFTYFSDNISLYSRTYPAVATMITGVDNNFSTNANSYFINAYQNSSFLDDLKSNGYKIKLYTQKYYCYRDGTALVSVADNISLYNGYKIADKPGLIKNLISLSAYRYAPNALKSKINVSTASFNGVVEFNGSYPLYEIDDPKNCGKILENGLSFDGDGNSYIFIHLNGCHSPYSMDENAERSSNASSDSQLRGCFKMIKYYIEEMKRLGVYDQSTIIITGDHPRAIDDTKEPSQPRLTALFAKQAGSTGPLQYSSAQVSQANLIPTIVSSSGISTDHNYGLSYFDIAEGTDTVRYHKFQLTVDNGVEIVTYLITGNGTSFENWSVYSRKSIGSLYR